MYILRSCCVYKREASDAAVNSACRVEGRFGGQSYRSFCPSLSLPALALEGAGDVLHVAHAVAGHVQGLVDVDLSTSTSAAEHPCC